MSRLYDKFKASSSLETNGVVRDFGYFRVTVARAGGANRKYNAAMDKIGKQHLRAIQNDLLGEERSRTMMIETYADTIILNWETNVGTEEEPDWKQGIEGPDGELLPFNRTNIIATLKALPDLFREIVEVATGLQFFRESLLEGVAKN